MGLQKKQKDVEEKKEDDASFTKNISIEEAKKRSVHVHGEGT